jgi:hypothetical protein
MRTLSGCLLGAMLLGACGQDTPSKQEQPMPVEETFAGDMIKQKQKIEQQAEQQVENRMPDLNRQVDAAEGAQPAEPQD